MTKLTKQEKLYEFVRPSYPDIKIYVVDTADNVRQLYFTDDKFELAPNENPEELDYHDQETIDDISLSGKNFFFYQKK